jgi:hypothetical protein
MEARLGMAERMTSKLLFSERQMLEDYADDPRVVAVVERVGRMRYSLIQSEACMTCSGAGSIPGFFLGTLKTCPACHGRGRR